MHSGIHSTLSGHYRSVAPFEGICSCPVWEFHRRLIGLLSSPFFLPCLLYKALIMDGRVQKLWRCMPWKLIRNGISIESCQYIVDPNINLSEKHKFFAVACGR